MTSVVEVYACLQKNDKSDLKGREDLMEAAHMHLSGIKT